MHCTMCVIFRYKSFLFILFLPLEVDIMGKESQPLLKTTKTCLDFGLGFYLIPTRTPNIIYFSEIQIALVPMVL